MVLWEQSGDTPYEEHMFPLFVAEQLDSWPEKEIRERSYLDELVLWNEITSSPLLTSRLLITNSDECSRSKKAVSKRMDERSVGTSSKPPHTTKQADQRGTISWNQTYLQRSSNYFSFGM